MCVRQLKAPGVQWGYNKPQGWSKIAKIMLCNFPQTAGFLIWATLATWMQSYSPSSASLPSPVTWSRASPGRRCPPTPCSGTVGILKLVLTWTQTHFLLAPASLRVQDFWGHPFLFANNGRDCLLKGLTVIKSVKKEGEIQRKWMTCSILSSLCRRFAYLMLKKDVSCPETKKDLLRKVKNAISSTAERFSGNVQNVRAPLLMVHVVYGEIQETVPFLFCIWVTFFVFLSWALSLVGCCFHANYLFIYLFLQYILLKNILVHIVAFSFFYWFW